MTDVYVAVGLPYHECSDVLGVFDDLGAAQRCCEEHLGNNHDGYEMLNVEHWTVGAARAAVIWSKPGPTCSYYGEDWDSTVAVGEGTH